MAVKIGRLSEITKMEEQYFWVFNANLGRVKYGGK